MARACWCSSTWAPPAAWPTSCVRYVVLCVGCVGGWVGGVCGWCVCVAGEGEGGGGGGEGGRGRCLRLAGRVCRVVVQRGVGVGHGGSSTLLPVLSLTGSLPCLSLTSPPPGVRRAGGRGAAARNGAAPGRQRGGGAGQAGPGCRAVQPGAGSRGGQGGMWGVHRGRLEDLQCLGMARRLVGLQKPPPPPHTHTHHHHHHHHHHHYQDATLPARRPSPPRCCRPPAPPPPPPPTPHTPPPPPRSRPRGATCCCPTAAACGWSWGTRRGRWRMPAQPPPAAPQASPRLPSARCGARLWVGVCVYVGGVGWGGMGAVHCQQLVKGGCALWKCHHAEGGPAPCMRQQLAPGCGSVTLLLLGLCTACHYRPAHLPCSAAGGRTAQAGPAPLSARVHAGRVRAAPRL